MAQAVTRRRPDVVRKLIVAGSGPWARCPDRTALAEDVLTIMAKPGGGDADDLLYLFYPDTDAARASGHEHLAKVSTRLAADGPVVSEAAAMGQFIAVGKILAIPFDRRSG